MAVAREQATTSLFVLEDLDDASRTANLTESELDALRSVADWINTFIARPNTDLGRPGTVCPFVPGALERQTLWLVAEHVADRSVADMVEVIRGYQRVFIDAQPREGEGALFKAIFVVFADLPADRAARFFDDVLDLLAIPSYVTDGFAMGGFFEGNEAAAIYNSSFAPFTSPVPSFLMRQTVVSDWKFFLDKEDWFTFWAHRFGESGAQSLAAALRRLHWRADGE